MEAINTQNTLLLMIDMQEKLLKAMSDAAACIGNNELLLKTAAILDLDLLLTEQYPAGLGNTVDELKCLLPEAAAIIEKTSFSCCGESNFRTVLKSKSRKNIAVCGIEAHVCVQQTVLDLLNMGYNVIIPADALCSRSSRDYELALAAMRHAGAFVTSAEALVFMLLRDARHPNFREIAKLIK
ncbi:MAG: isochorismatase family protein [Victivallales bacterium]|nr:isochorismatase family protein [Victivallales bacterium]